MAQTKSFGGKLPAVTNGRQALRLAQRAKTAPYVQGRALKNIAFFKTIFKEIRNPPVSN